MINSYLIIIPIHNEEKVIEKTIEYLLKIDYEKNLFKIIFILDNCNDKSLEIIKRFNLDYLEKNDNELKGKSFALKWLIKNYKEINKFSKIVILDADSLIDKKFLKEIFDYESYKIIQGFVNPIFNKNSISSSVSAYSEILSQKIKDLIKTKLNWSVLLRGTGMVIDKDIFVKYLQLLKTQIEDTELSIQLVKNGYKIKFIPEAVIYDPKPLNIKQASNQRARWLYGQFQIIKYYWKDLIKIAFSGIGNFFFVLDVILKPKTLFYILKFLFLILFILTNFPYRTFFIIILSILISIDILYFLIGGLFVEDKKHYYKTLLFSPIYIIIWFISIIKMILVRGSRWLKAR
jgi:cellulose synthase/poly-beta-1,6-N-acetylglucosamine synthase-like glycosyltransferase